MTKNKKEAKPEHSRPHVIFAWWHSPKLTINGVVECLNDGAAHYIDLRKMMEETGRPPSWYMNQLEQAALRDVDSIRIRVESKYVRPLQLLPNVHAAIGLLNEQRVFDADSHLITPEFEGAVEYVTAQIGLALAEVLPRKES